MPTPTVGFGYGQFVDWIQPRRAVLPDLLTPLALDLASVLGWKLPALPQSEAVALLDRMPSAIAAELRMLIEAAA